jgi:hypothetical protein
MGANLIPTYTVEKRRLFVLHINVEINDCQVFIRWYFKKLEELPKFIRNPEVAKWANYDNISTNKETETCMQHSTKSNMPYIKRTTVTNYNR